MTREEQLVFCKKCTNRKLDFELGMLCGLTEKKADFNIECPSFIKDDTVIENAGYIQSNSDRNISIRVSKDVITKLKSEQNITLGVISGIIVGTIGALLWGFITVKTGYQIGYMSLAIGAGVGLSIRYMGKGIDEIFGFIGGGIAIVSCLLGNFYSIIGAIANYESLGFFETLFMFDYSQLFSVMSSTFKPIDILFYLLAAYEGYKFSFRNLEEKDLQ